MDLNFKASVYLTKLSLAVRSLSDMAGESIEPPAMTKVIVTMLELEQSAADFIAELDISAESAKLCRGGFIRANEVAIGYLEKLQLQVGYNLNELRTALKLECETLREELNLS